MPRLSFFPSSRLSMRKGFSLIKRPLHHQLLNEVKNKGFISELKNDLSPEENKDSYSNRSWKDFKRILKEQTFYIYVDKATLSPHLYPGHTASFLTDSKSDVIEDSFISLRNGDFIPNKQLTGTFAHDPTKTERNNGVWRVKFIKKPEEEFSKHLFKEAKAIPKEKDKRRFLIGVPQGLIIASMQKFIEHVKRFKENYKDKEYILFDGKVNGSFAKSLNCVTGVYEGAGVKGSISNPSPQMAAWTYLRFVLGEEVRDSLIKDVNLRVHGIERIEDDGLTPQATPEKVFCY